MIVKEYVREDGSNPYQKWFNSLNAQAAAKITVAIARLELANTQILSGLTGLVNIELIGVQVIEFIWHEMERN